MNARRMTTTLGALALGIATIGIVPALAQTGGASTNGTSPGAAAGGMSPTQGGPSTAPSSVTGRPGGTSSGGMNMGMERSGGAMGHRHATMSGHRGHEMMGAQAQNPEVDRLNQQSLEAARKHEAFTPSSQP